MNKIVALIAIAVVLVGGWAVMKNSYKGAELLDSVGGAVSPIGDIAGGTSEEAKTENVKDFTVDGTSFSFAPKTMEVKVGDMVRITFINKEGFHDLVIDEFVGAKTKQLKAGESETITFVADKAGTFEYYCSVGAHRAQGMVGHS
jgi:Plastocyanin